MSRFVRLVQLGLLLGSSGGLAGQPAADPVAAAIERSRLPLRSNCDGTPDEVLVCGTRPGFERYRIPEEMRESPEPRSSDSWYARSRDLRETMRYEDQITGPAGAFARSRQIDCQWRAERQQIAGQQPDCTRQIRPLP